MSRKKEEVFLRDIKKTNRNFKLNLKINFQEEWLKYSLIGSFFLLIILNYILPSKPIHETKFEINNGFLGLVSTFFGSILLLNALFTGEEILPWLFGAILCLILLYFGLPMLFGFNW